MSKNKNELTKEEKRVNRELNNLTVKELFKLCTPIKENLERHSTLSDEVQELLEQFKTILDIVNEKSQSKKTVFLNQQYDKCYHKFFGNNNTPKNEVKNKIEKVENETKEVESEPKPKMDANTFFILGDLIGVVPFMYNSIKNQLNSLLDSFEPNNEVDNLKETLNSKQNEKEYQTFHFDELDSFNYPVHEKTNLLAHKQIVPISKEDYLNQVNSLPLFKGSVSYRLTDENKLIVRNKLSKVVKDNSENQFNALEHSFLVTLQNMEQVHLQKLAKSDSDNERRKFINYDEPMYFESVLNQHKALFSFMKDSKSGHTIVTINVFCVNYGYDISDSYTRHLQIKALEMFLESGIDYSESLKTLDDKIKKHIMDGLNVHIQNVEKGYVELNKKAPLFCSSYTRTKTLLEDFKEGLGLD